jgi:hypothetical protein
MPDGVGVATGSVCDTASVATLPPIEQGDRHSVSTVGTDAAKLLFDHKGFHP